MRRPLFAALVLASPLALADVPPPGGETCLVEKVQQAGEECSACATHREAPEACKGRFDGTWTYRCQTSSATAWTELWCRATTDAGAPESTDGGEPVPLGATQPSSESPKPPEPKVNPPGDKGDCATAPVGLLALVALGLVARRRR